MLIKRLFPILIILYCSGICFAEDVATENTGEKAMITSLREAINSDSVLKSMQDKIVLGAGVSGAEAFKDIAKQNELHVLLTWQWLDNLQNLAKGTIIVVPEHSIDARFKALEDKGIRLIPISGVLHTKTISKVQNESMAMIDPSTSHIVMLAGDTQQEDGSWVVYDREMLDELLRSLPRDQNILILNGPRTGKHLENSSVIDDLAHKTRADYITRIVLEQGVQNWKVVDFKYGEKSIWDNALNFCITHTNVALILPGESTSMISEALSLGILPIVYEHKAMTATSHKYLKQLRQEGKMLEYPIDLGRQHYSQDPSENQIEKIITSLRSFIKN